MPNKKKPDFEKALAELEQLVARLEQGDLTLDESLKDFERGVELTRLCQQGLEQAEQKVRQLTGGDDIEREVPLDTDSDE